MLSIQNNAMTETDLKNKPPQILTVYGMRLCVMLHSTFFLDPIFTTFFLDPMFIVYKIFPPPIGGEKILETIEFSFTICSVVVAFLVYFIIT